jgi:CheY-like chemotaxis protein
MMLEPTAAGVFSGHEARALVVDDDPILRSLVAARLGGIVDQVVEAADGLDAWRLLASERFQLALVDIMMPNLDGLALIQCVRGHPRTRHMPIVVITSSHDRSSIEKALAAGASAFMTKPLTWSTFDAHIQHLLRLSSAAEAAEAAELALERHRAIAQAQAAFAAATAAFAHGRFRQLAVAAEQGGNAADRLAAIARDAASAEAGCEHLRALNALIGSADAMARCSHNLAHLLASARAVADDDIVQASLELELPRLDHLEVTGSCEALVLVLVSALRVVAQGAGTGGRLRIESEHRADRLVLALDVAGGWSGLAPEEIAADLAIAAQLPGADRAFEVAVMRTLLEAHGGSLAMGDGAGGARRLELGLPIDRVRLASTASGARARELMPAA